jgi:hypothetical protein
MVYKTKDETARWVSKGYYASVMVSPGGGVINGRNVDSVFNTEHTGVTVSSYTCVGRGSRMEFSMSSSVFSEELVSALK